MADTAANDSIDPEAAKAEAPRLRRLNDNRTHILSAVTVVGRNDECDIVIDDEQGVSRKHARFTIDGQQVQFLDLGSLNGTLINGKESDGQQTLTNGDILVFDEQEYELLIPGTEIEDYDSDVTVIANRADIGRRGRIVSEVSVVDDEFLRRVRQSNPPARAIESPPVKPEHPQVEQRPHVDQDETIAPDTSHEMAAASSNNDASAANMSSAANVANLTQPTLIVRVGDSMRIRLVLDSTRNSWTIGSAADRDLSIEHDGVDSNHATLLREGSVWTLYDRRSTNGSYVNGEQIDSANIVSGDILRLGSVDCLFVCPADNILHETPTPSTPSITRSAPVDIPFNIPVDIPIDIPIDINADYDQQTTIFDMALDDVDVPPFRPRRTDDHQPVGGGRPSPHNKRHGWGLLQRLGLDPRIILTLCIATTLVLAIIALLLLM